MEKARLIVEKGHADINLKNVDGETAAIEALRVKDIEMARKDLMSKFYRKAM